MFNDSSVYIFFGENEGLKYADNVKQCFFVIGESVHT